MVVVEETDRKHGHIAFEVHRDACPTELRHALDEHPRVRWYRAKEFQDVSLRLILRRVLGRHGACNGDIEDDDVYIERRRTPPTLTSLIVNS